MLRAQYSMIFKECVPTGSNSIAANHVSERSQFQHVGKRAYERRKWPTSGHEKATWFIGWSGYGGRNDCWIRFLYISLFSKSLQRSKYGIKFIQEFL